MSGADRRKYLTATVLNQALLDWSQDNLECRIESIVDIEKPDGSGVIHASDRNKYVVNGGTGTFYEALTVFPVVTRTLGEWLTPELQFSTLELELSNVDQRFNKYLPAGASFASWVNREITIKCGLAEVGASYFPIFTGIVTEAAGASRTVKSIKFTARDQNEKFNQKFPNDTLTKDTFPDIDDSISGKILPVIYGDFTVEVSPDPAIVPSYPVNGKHLSALSGTIDVTIDTPDVTGTGTNFGVDVIVGDRIVVGTETFTVSAIADAVTLTLDSDTTVGYTGATAYTFSRTNVQFVTSFNDLLSFDTTKVYLKRNSAFYLVPSADVVNVGAGNRSFEIKQNTANLWIDGTSFIYESGDEFLVQVTGKDLGAYNDNIVEQARDILITFGGMSSGDFHSNWDTYRDKATPPKSAIALIKSRVWIQEPEGAMTFALSLLEQVRLEAFFDMNGKCKINALHFEDWDATPGHTVYNWDVEQGSLNLAIDEKNNFNRAQATFNRFPSRESDGRQTKIYRNSLAITQIGNREISKRVEFPNLYVEQDVIYQLTEILRLASSMIEIATTTLTWRSLLQDLGGFVSLNVQIGSAQFDHVPAMIRDIGYDPNGFKLPVKLWVFSMTPFPGYTPGYYGTVGGYDAAIDPEL